MDIAANIVVGTKWLQPAETPKSKCDGEATSIPKIPSVTTYTRRVKYKHAYGVPAFFSPCTPYCGFVPDPLLHAVLWRKTVNHAHRLQHTSVGRLLTSHAASRQLGCSTQRLGMPYLLSKIGTQMLPRTFGSKVLEETNLRSEPEDGPRTSNLALSMR